MISFHICQPYYYEDRRENSHHLMNISLEKKELGSFAISHFWEWVTIIEQGHS